MVSNKCHQVTVASHANLLVFRLRNIGVDKASTASAGTQIEQNREVLWHTPHGVVICAEYSAIVDLRRYKYTKVGLWNLGTVYIYIYISVYLETLFQRPTHLQIYTVENIPLADFTFVPGANVGFHMERW